MMVLGRYDGIVTCRFSTKLCFFSISPASEYAQTAHEITDHPTTDCTAKLKKLAFDIILVQFIEYMLRLSRAWTFLFRLEDKFTFYWIDQTDDFLQ